MATTTRTIKGEEYRLTAGTGGRAFKVTKLATGTTHYVTAAGGTVAGCSCPDHHHRGRVCKHMAEVQLVLDERDAETGKASSLESPTRPTLYRFTGLVSGRVRVERWDGGTRTEQYVLPHDVAGSRHRHLWRIGYRPCGYLTRQAGGA